MKDPILSFRNIFSSLTIINEDFGFDEEFIEMIYESTRPYDGKIKYQYRKVRKSSNGKIFQEP
jgi:hypothetical protein